VIEIDATAPTFGKLASFYDPMVKKKEGEKSKEALDALTPGSFYSMKQKGDRITITRTFVPTKKKAKKKQSEEDKNAAAMMGLMGGPTMRFELTVPGKVLSSNAEDSSGGRLVWVIPAAYLQEHKVTLTAEIEVSPELVRALGKK
jgi:hypothetical protein